MMHPLLALSDPLISGNWIVAVISALTSGAALFWGKSQKDQKDKAMESNVTIENQPLGISLEKALATVEQVEALEVRIEGQLSQIRITLKEEQNIARIANGNLHARLDKVIEAQAEHRGELRQINKNVERLLERGMKS